VAFIIGLSLALDHLVAPNLRVNLLLRLCAKRIFCERLPRVVAQLAGTRL
jgi:hypothetical protein